MFGLLIKDVYTLRTELKLLLLYFIAMLIVQNDFLFGYGVFYATMLPVTALGYDERARWHKLANTMPYSKNQLVGSKYLLGVLFAAVMLLFAVSTKFIGTAFGNPWMATDWLAILFIFFMALLMQAVLLPLMFWIGTEKGRYLFILIMVVGIIFVMTISEKLDFASIQISSAVLLAAAALVTVVFSLVSFLLSRRLYARYAV